MPAEIFIGYAINPAGIIEITVFLTRLPLVMAGLVPAIPVFKCGAAIEGTVARRLVGPRPGC